MRCSHDCAPCAPLPLNARWWEQVVSLSFFSAAPASGAGHFFRDSLVTLTGVLLSVFVLVNVLVPQQSSKPVSRPTTEDRGEYGLYALHQWLRQSGVKTLSLRKPLNRVGPDELPPRGNVMVLSLPYAREALVSDWTALNQWVMQGNTVLVMAALYSLPDWIVHNDIFESVQRLTGDEFVLQRKSYAMSNDMTPPDLDTAPGWQQALDRWKPARIRLRPAIEHPLFENIDSLDSFYMPALLSPDDSDKENNVQRQSNATAGIAATDSGGSLQGAYYTIDSEDARLALGLMTAADEAVSSRSFLPADTAVMWLLPIGEGWVYLSAFSELLGNGVVKQTQNVRWFTR
ncbi:MAG TPA: DUF4350 domain-containing protein, partial [Thiotrichales bacterium]|nr:DUF4350 domain-containing protein [Thiotrichales bacterium]